VEGVVGGVRGDGAPVPLPRPEVGGQKRGELLGDERDPVRRVEAAARDGRVRHAVLARARAAGVLPGGAVALGAQTPVALVRLVGHSLAQVCPQFRLCWATASISRSWLVE
jgi:hypothetical protein